MSTVAQDYPARLDTNGTKWYRPAVRDAREIWGWTSDIKQADPSYIAAIRERLKAQNAHNQRSGALPSSAATDTPIAPLRPSQHPAYPGGVL
jgi:hypothetical protein